MVIVSRTERHERILSLALIHGILTAEWIYPELYPGLTIHSAVKDLQLLRDEGLLRPFDDTSRRVYYTPTEKLCAIRGVYRSFGRAGDVNSVARRAGIAWYCLRYGLDRYTARRFRDEFPELAPKKGACGHYYVDRSEEPHQIGWVEVDCNTKGDPRRTVRAVARLFRIRKRAAAWQALIEAGQFHVVVVTPSQGKKERLERAFAKAKEKPANVFIEVVEELQAILLKEDETCYSPRNRPWRAPGQHLTSRPSSADQRPSETGTSGSEPDGAPPSSSASGSSPAAGS